MGQCIQYTHLSKWHMGDEQQMLFHVGIRRLAPALHSSLLTRLPWLVTNRLLPPPTDSEADHVSFSGQRHVRESATFKPMP